MEPLSITSPELFKHQKHCRVCHRRFGARRADAKYCSDACRQKAYRASKPKKSRKEIVAAQLAGRRATTHQGTCAHCGRTFYTDGTGTARIYCNNACRQAAYRERKRKERIAPELAFLETTRSET